MQYSQTREQSAEILRITIGHMGRQQASFHPASYALWYEHAAGLNPPLSVELEARINANSPLTEADVWRLYSTYIASRDAQAVESMRSELLQLLNDTSDLASSSGVHVVAFGEQLQGHSRNLQKSATAARIEEVLRDLLEQTQHMCTVNSTLSQQLASSTQKVHDLTHRLRNTQAEALTDPLTGLRNRRGLERALEERRDAAQGLKGVSLMLADVDHFKRINDEFGHLAGDQVLQAVARTFHTRTKGCDIAARLGGDEFAVLLPETTAEGALALAEQIRAALQRERVASIAQGAYVHTVTLSVGIAHCDAGGSLDSLIQRADLALYAAKRAGRNRVCTAPPTGTGAGR